MKVVTQSRSFLGCGDDEDSSHKKRPKFVDFKPINGMDADLRHINFWWWWPTWMLQI